MSTASFWSISDTREPSRTSFEICGLTIMFYLVLNSHFPQIETFIPEERRASLDSGYRWNAPGSKSHGIGKDSCHSYGPVHNCWLTCRTTGKFCRRLHGCSSWTGYPHWEGLFDDSAASESSMFRWVTSTHAPASPLSLDEIIFFCLPSISCVGLSKALLTLPQEKSINPMHNRTMLWT